MPRSSAGSAAAALVAPFCVLAASAAASPGPATGSRLAWSTYLRAGPDETAAAIVELEHDTPVAVLSCTGRWCRVSAGDARGYVDRDALDLPRTAAPVPPARTDCVTAGQADNRGPVATRFCSATGGST